MWFQDRFTGPDLDREVWFPHYLPAWSSRADTAAAYRAGAEGLVLDLPVDHPRWCPDTHATPLRLSGVQSGNFSEWSTGEDDHLVPRLVVDRVAGDRSPTS